MVYRPEGFFYGPRAWRRTPADPGLRVGDAERNQVAEALSQHYSDGRLDATEFKERLDKAMGAKTRGELTGLLGDLPPLADPPPPGPRRRRVGLWIAAAAFVLFLSVPWGAAPGTWWWFPHIPWLVIGIIALIAWRSGRRHHRLPGRS